MNDKEKLKTIRRIASMNTDENIGDWTETRETILWVATDREEGWNWGHTWVRDDAEWKQYCQETGKS